MHKHGDIEKHPNKFPVDRSPGASLAELDGPKFEATSARVVQGKMARPLIMT